MPRLKKDKKILRLIDANLNRLLEGLRVCEEVMRFIACDKYLTLELKKIRHAAVNTIKNSRIPAGTLLVSRGITNDVGKSSIKDELIRKDYRNIFFANIQRGKESLRVLEEFSKLASQRSAGSFKALRYKLYKIEQKAACRL